MLKSAVKILICSQKLSEEEAAQMSKEDILDEFESYSRRSYE